MQIAKKLPMAGGMVVRSTKSLHSAATKLSTLASSSSLSSFETVSLLAAGNAVVLFSMTGCCMCTVAKRLLFGLGVGPTIIELDELDSRVGFSAAKDVEAALFRLAAEGQQPVPAVFVGGKFLGGIETLMASHINGTLIPLLKDAGALWL